MTLPFGKLYFLQREREREREREAKHKKERDSNYTSSHIYSLSSKEPYKEQ